MSARERVQAAVVSALQGAGVTAFDAPPVRGGLPHAVVGEPVLRDWSTATWEGREGAIVVSFFDAGERPVRLRAAIEVGEAAVASLGAELGDGWRLVQMRLQRSRVARAKDTQSGARWMGISEFLVRVWREQ